MGNGTTKPAKTTFLVWNVDQRFKRSQNKMFSFLALMMKKLRSSHLYTPVPVILLHISYIQGYNQNWRLPLERLTIKKYGTSWEACKPSQGSQALPIQTPQVFQAKFRHFSWCWMASFSRGCTTSAWACELDSDLTGLFEFAITPKCILVNNTQFSIHHLLFESN